MKNNLITNKYPHSSLGLLAFKLCAGWTIFLAKHKLLYYVLSCSWGLIMTLFGSLLTVILFITSLFIKNIKFYRYNWIYAICAGPDYWGGFETGLMFIRDQKSSKHLNAHEFGHTFQNCLFGPLFPILVGLPSAIRYWIREFKGTNGKAYDAIWFEDAATQCGEYVDKILNKN